MESGHKSRKYLEIEVKPAYHSLPFTILKVVAAIPLLLVSLLFYLAGLLLTITILGAIIGIPLILTTYAFDAVAISMLLNPRLKIEKVYCPHCGKGKRIIPTVMTDFTCKRCKAYIVVKIK